METQVPSPPRAYPDPAPSDTEVSDGPPFFQPRRSQQQSLSHDDQSLANSLANGMNGHMGPLPPRVGSAQGQNFDVGTQAGLPQTPHQPSTDVSMTGLPHTQHEPPTDGAMTGQHSGMDPNQDLSYGMGSDRRKRSKVSRACDECRRKKVRCDSTTSDGNVIETCSNCRRLKLTCQFERAPMKRGPSKGYIKELAERVQHVESQMGMPVTYRQSFDAASPPDAYPEPSYSPPEPMSSSRKRTFSQFDGRNPFVQAGRTSRDGLTSLGGGGGRGSLSLAPDQQLPDVSPTPRVPSTDLTKPFWAQETEVEHPRSKGIAATSAPVGDLWQEDSLFSDYVNVVHDDISILPKSFEIVQLHVRQCSQEVASAFSHVVANAVGRNTSAIVYADDPGFEKYVWVNARMLPGSRNTSENIVWLWMYTFMLINVDADIARLGGTDKFLSKQTVLKMALDLAQSLLAPNQQDMTRELGSGLEAPRDTVLRTWSCVSIYAKLHAMGTGAEDSTDLSNSRSPLAPMETQGLLSESTARLAVFSDISSLLTSHMAASAGTRPNLITNNKTRKIVESCIETVISTFPTTFVSSTLVQEYRLFISLLLARHTFVNDPTEILALTVQLVDVLVTDPVNPHGHEPAVAKPLDIHLYSLSGLTLLELIDSEDEDLVKNSQAALAKLHEALEQVSERAHVRRLNKPDDYQSAGLTQLHWADALLRIIDAKRGGDAIRTPAPAANNGPESSGATTRTEEEPTTANGDDHNKHNNNYSDKENIQVISTQQQYLISRLLHVAQIQKTIRTRTTTMTVLDFSLLTRRGYLNVLANLNGY